MNNFLNYIKYFYTNSKKHSNNHSNILNINLHGCNKTRQSLITSRNTIKISYILNLSYNHIRHF